VTYFQFVAEEVREWMAQLGFRKVTEMIGRVDKIRPQKAIHHWKAKGIDLTSILQQPETAPGVATHCVESQNHGLEKALDHQLIESSRPALEGKHPVRINLPVRNIHRTVGTILSGEVARKFGPAGLPPDTIQIHLTGSAGQSFGAFLMKGISLHLEGESNDYLGKGIFGGRIVVVPPKESTFVPEETIIIGNVALYGATGGETFFGGMAGERFAVRNSGATAVVEGVGDHGCEYMTGGVVVVLGKTGRNFAAGMSGGAAYVLNEDGRFESRCNLAMIDLEPVRAHGDAVFLRGLIELHFRYTGSKKAKSILSSWENVLPKFVKVIPVEYRRVLEEKKSKTWKETPIHG
jgi:glutamate synthase (NADPH) large chain